MNWGEALIKSVTSGRDPLVKDLSDIYTLSIEDLALHCSGMKHAKKCHDSLHSQKTLTISLVLSSLNIPLLGINTANDIVTNGFDSLESIINIKEDDLLKIPNIGKKTAKIIYNGINSKSYTINELAKHLVITKQPKGVLTGQTFCITGSTKKPRNLLRKMILDNGGSYKDTVVSGLSYLITNEDTESYKSDKVKKAEKYNIQIKSEEFLLSLMS